MFVTQAYYEEEYGGALLDAPFFETLSKKAERNIQTLTRYKVADFSTLPETAQKRVREAICMQIDYLEANGLSADTAQESGFSIGSYSVSGTTGKEGLQYPSAIEDVLLPTGLLYRGVATW